MFCPHLGRAFESVLGREPTAIGLADIGALGNAEQRIVSLEHAVIGEEHVIGGD